MQNYTGTWVHATPELQAATEAHLGCFPSSWRERVTCASCGGKCRGYRNKAGEFAPEPLLRRKNDAVDKDVLKTAGFEWWFCDVCHAHGYHEHLAIPADTPAGAQLLEDVLHTKKRAARRKDLEAALREAESKDYADWQELCGIEARVSMIFDNLKKRRLVTGGLKSEIESLLPPPAPESASIEPLTMLPPPVEGPR